MPTTSVRRSFITLLAPLHSDERASLRKNQCRDGRARDGPTSRNCRIAEGDLAGSEDSTSECRERNQATTTAFPPGSIRRPLPDQKLRDVAGEPERPQSRRSPSAPDSPFRPQGNM